MAKNEKNESAETCLFVYNSGKQCDREVTGRGLCNTHYQKGLKTVAASKAGKLLHPKTKKPIIVTWDTLVAKGRAKEANKSTGQDFFIKD